MVYLIILGVMCYLLMVGVVWAYWFNRNHSDNESMTYAFFWPLTFPVMVGIALLNWLTNHKEMT